MPADASGLPTGWIVAGVVTAIAVVGIVLHERLVPLPVRCDDARSDSDVQLARRHDPIPHVIESVRGDVRRVSGGRTPGNPPGHRLRMPPPPV